MTSLKRIKKLKFDPNRISVSIMTSLNRIIEIKIRSQWNKCIHNDVIEQSNEIKIRSQQKCHQTVAKD